MCVYVYNGHNFENEKWIIKPNGIAIWNMHESCAKEYYYESPNEKWKCVCVCVPIRRDRKPNGDIIVLLATNFIAIYLAAFYFHFTFLFVLIPEIGAFM